MYTNTVHSSRHGGARDPLDWLPLEEQLLELLPPPPHTHTHSRDPLHTAAAARRQAGREKTDTGAWPFWPLCVNLVIMIYRQPD